MFAHLPVPKPLNIHSAEAAEEWKHWRKTWENYALATELKDKEAQVLVATPLTIIGNDANRVFETFEWTDENHKTDIEQVLNKFETYTKPRINIPLERYRFNCRQQESNESIDRYVTALRQLACKCDFSTVTPDELLRDRILFGITDCTVRERLLRVQNLTLKKTLDICRAAEMSQKQLKEVEDLQGEQVNSLRHYKPRHPRKRKTKQSQQTYPRKPPTSTGTRGTGNKQSECKYCGRLHEFKKEICPAYGKTCLKCKKKNHFASKCMQDKRLHIPEGSFVKQVDEETDHGSEIFQITSVNVLDDSQLVTLKIKNGNRIQFQLNTGAQCNVLPLHNLESCNKGCITRKHDNRVNIIYY